VALSWLIHQPQVIAIPMSTNPKHLKENLGALDVELSEEDFERLNRLA
jgi:diketogulonate reductase-like aldo/keto reductase